MKAKILDLLSRINVLLSEHDKEGIRVTVPMLLKADLENLHSFLLKAYRAEQAGIRNLVEQDPYFEKKLNQLISNETIASIHRHESQQKATESNQMKSLELDLNQL